MREATVSLVCIDYLKNQIVVRSSFLEPVLDERGSRRSGAIYDIDIACS